MSPIERYAMRFVEETGGSWTAEQLRAAEAEIEQQKREWEANRLAALKKAEEDAKRAADEENEMLTYSRQDAQNQVNNRTNKRRSVNRRSLGAARKQQNRDNSMNKISKPKRTPSGDIILVQTVTRPALRSEAEGTRRILRNSIRNNNTSNSTSLMRRATANSSRKSSMSSEPARITRTSPSKRGAHLRSPRGPGRPAKRTRRYGMTVSSDDDNESNGSDASDSSTIENTTNGRENASKSRDTSKSRVESDENEKSRSDELDDSECSLDVMIDSEEEDQSEGQTRQTSDRSADGEYTDDNEDEAYSISSDEDDDDEYSKENIRALNSTAFDSVDNHIDTNTPRTTRSHGPLKINLFQLDVSQVLPELRAKRLNQTRRGRNANANATNNGIGDSDDDETTNGLEMSVDSDSESSTRRNSRSTARTDAKHCDSNNSTPPAKGQNRSSKRSVNQSPSIAKQTPPTHGKTGRNTSTTNDGHNNTVDNWDSVAHRTPKIILDKNECDKQRQLQNQKTGLTVNSKLHRRSDVNKR